MFKVLAFLMLCTITLKAQILPKFENDTLYTKCGFKIYKGQKLKFAKGTGRDGTFASIKVRGSDNPKRLTNRELEVTEVSDYYISGLENAYIKIHGTYADSTGKIKKIKFKMIFEKALGEKAGVRPEIIAPSEFICGGTAIKTTELEELYGLYQKGILTKEEYETQKRRLLER